jgi:hypothetical protein
VQKNDLEPDWRLLQDLQQKPASYTPARDLAHQYGSFSTSLEQLRQHLHARLLWHRAEPDRPAVRGQPFSNGTAVRNTETKLSKAADAVNTVHESQENDKEPSDQQKQTLSLAVNEWLEASEHEMRLVALSAQSEGKDVKGAVEALADETGKSLNGDIFNVESLNGYVIEARNEVLDERGATRQVRSEQYTAQQAGDKQLAEARQKQPDLEAAAMAAQQRAESFTAAFSTESQVDAKNHAQQDATEKRAAADAGKHQIEGLTLAYEGFTDPATEFFTPGAVTSEYEARALDIRVKEYNAAFQRIYNSGVGGKTLADAGVQLDEGLTNQRLAHADRDVAATRLELADTRVERDRAQAAHEWPILADNTVGPSLDETLFRWATDRKLLNQPATPGQQKQAGQPPMPGQLLPLTKVTADKYNEADQNAQAALRRQSEAYGDLVSSDPKKSAPLDVNTICLNREKDLSETLTKAQVGTIAAQNELHQAQGISRDAGTVRQLGLTLGKSKETELTAQADVNTLNAMRALRDAQRREANGEKIVPEEMAKLRASARGMLKQSFEAGPR